MTSPTNSPKPLDPAALAAVSGGITGTFNNDRLTGSNGNNTFDAGHGNDVTGPCLLDWKSL